MEKTGFIVLIIGLTVVLSGCNESKDTTSTDNDTLTDEEIQEMNGKFESLLGSTEQVSGSHISLSMNNATFKLGAPLIETIMDQGSSYSSSVPIYLDISILSNMSYFNDHKMIDIYGYFEKDNINTFSGSKSTSEGLFSSMGPYEYTSWKPQPAGSYVYYYAKYNYTQIVETLEKSYEDINTQEIILNFIPVLYDKIEITVLEERINCDDYSDPNSCWSNLALATGDCSYCDNIVSNFNSPKEDCLENCNQT